MTLMEPQPIAAPPPEQAELLTAIAPAIVASAIDCIVVIDDGGTVVEFNPAAERTFGYRRDEVVGRPIADLIIPPHLRERHHAGMRRYMTTGIPHVLGRRVEIEAMRADGHTFPVELAITEVGLAGSRLFTAYIRDLTEVREAEAEIERQREQLYQSEKLAALGSLLAGVAHELNNPLSIVIGQALMMREACSAPELSLAQIRKLAERSAKIEAASERCARIVRTFLAMARQRTSERRPVDIPAMIDGAIELLAYGLRTAGVEIVRDVPQGIPHVWGDGDQLHQVVVNLIINAKQALEDVSGPRRITIAVRHDEETGHVALTISDSGPGVPEDIRSRVFDPFFTTKPQGVGTGVGLAISRGLVDSHGGSLTLLPSQPGSGASFELSLPIGEGSSHPVVPVTEEPAAPTPRRRALIVDDEEEVAQILAELVERHGFDCTIMASGSAAMEHIRGDSRFDVVLCDIRMPDGDGPSFHDWLVTEAPHLARRIGFVTGDTLGPAAARFLQRSGRPALEKPFGPDHVARLLEALSEPH